MKAPSVNLVRKTQSWECAGGVWIVQQIVICVLHATWQMSIPSNMPSKELISLVMLGEFMLCSHEFYEI